MAKLRKFTFDFDFDAPPVPKAPPPPPEPVYVMPEPDPEPVYIEPPAPMFSEAELELVREQAYEMGRSAGMQDAEQLTSRLTAHALSAIEARLRELISQQAQAQDRQIRDAAALGLAVVRKILPELARRHGLAEVEAVLQECLMQIDHDPRVTIRVNPLLVEQLKATAQTIIEQTGFEGRLVFTADARIGPTDCRIEWGDGGAERDQASLWAEISGIIARGLGPEMAE